MEDSLQGNVSSFHPRRSPRFVQRDAHLQLLRVTYVVKRDSMTEEEKQVLLEKRRNAYRIGKTKIGCNNTAETSDQGNALVSGSTT
ncbi:hypothetical protein MKW92_049176, partial [Papaver armeniacum]